MKRRAQRKVPVSTQKRRLTREISKLDDAIASLWKHVNSDLPEVYRAIDLLGSGICDRQDKKRDL